MGSIMEPHDIGLYANMYNRTENYSEICMSIGKISSRGLFHGGNPMDYSLPLVLVQLSLASGVILFTSCLLKPLGQPSMVSQILGGLILGPSFLGRFGEFAAIVFPLKGLLMLDTLAIFGYMFYFFLIGVQIDPWILKKIEKKEFIIGMSTVALAIVLSVPSCFLLMDSKIGIEPNIASSLPVLATTSSVLGIHSVAHYLTELKLLNSEFGRMAMSSSIVSNLFSFCIITLTVLTNRNAGEKVKTLETISTGIAMAMVIFFLVRPLILWTMRGIPDGEQLKQGFICSILVGVLVTALCSQASGLNIFFGPLLYGIAIPAGPPLGSALVEKLDLVTRWILMPIYFLKNGLVNDIFSVKFKNYLLLQFIILVACIGKFLGALIPAIYCKVPSRDAISLGLVMNVQGVLELGMFKMMKEAKAIDNESFVVACTSMLIMTATITPIIRYLYDPSRRYAVYKRRTVLHSRPDSELRVLACIHDQQNVPTIINLLQAIYPTKHSPVAIYVLHLVELVGRAHPLLIPHHPKRQSSVASTSKSIVNAFRLFEQSYHGIVSVYPFTSISPYSSMHDEVCAMALDKRVSLIIVPFPSDSSMGSKRKELQIMNDTILDAAPCSVAITVDRGLLNSLMPIYGTWSSYRVAVLFLGGADDREALALGARMAGQPNVNLTIVRLLENGSIASNDTTEKKLDNEVLSELRFGMAGNYRVMYIEEVVMDGTGTVAVIRSMENNYELLIVGRRHDTQSPLILGLSVWSGETALGALGDMLASEDFESNATILVVQQQTNILNQRHWNKKETLHVFQESL